MTFEQGAVGSIIMSFAAPHAGYDGSHPITIFGTKGTLSVPDPNNFDGTVRFNRWDGDGKTWEEIPQVFSHQYGRAVGLADMCQAIGAARDFRASGVRAMSVLDLMLGFLDSSRSGAAYKPTIAYERPAPMPIGKPFDVLT